MADRGQRLEIVEGRELVYCHSCEHQWYQDQHPGSLECPSCHGEFSEIITAENDPRRSDDASSRAEGIFRRFSQRPSSSPSSSARRHSDSDPDEDDIDNHQFNGPGGFFGQRNVYRSPGMTVFGQRTRVRPGHGEDILQRFTEMLHDMGNPRLARRWDPETDDAEEVEEDLYGNNEAGPGFVFRTIGGGSGFAGGLSSFTIARPIPVRGGGREAAPDLTADAFQEMFTEMLGSMAGPPMRQNDDDGNNNNAAAGSAGGGGREGGPRAGHIAAVLNQLIATIARPDVIHGDVVYTQEQLDRIVSNLMEMNPQSNAPPPAAEDLIASLPKKRLDEEMLGPERKGECTICIDEVTVGDEVVVLPCRHWFHEECASLWLRQHNSCPVCRAAIDDGPVAAGRSQQQSRNDTSASASASRPQGESAQPPTPRVNAYGRTSTGEFHDDVELDYDDRYPGYSGAARLRQAREEMMRDFMVTPPDRRQPPPSVSPPTVDASAQQRSSPSPSDRDRDRMRGSSSGFTGWIRDRFGR
ncbi:hypothetical protein F5Y17DRAFT_442503 [Xylariaceae sp. FL0594]|nr:hypothetical protein F5Y17DRAFT_442503 [Xylariaceae sp. FL0594]